MAILVKYRGLDLTFGTLADVDSFADELEARKPRHADSPKQREVSPGDRQSLSAVITGMNERQRSLLINLAGRPENNEGLDDSELREMLSLPNNQALAGLIGGISKRLKGAKHPTDALITSEVKMDGKRKYYRYMIQPKALREVTESLT